jgi:RimJ/RimL family protein N-acetyltransferase
VNIVVGHENTIIDWLARKHGVHVIQTPRQVLGVVDGDGVLRGAYVITWRNDTTAEWHLFGTLSNDTLKQLFRAVFGPWEVKRLEVRTHRRNKAVKRAAPKYGFKFECVARDYYGPKQDAFCYAMTPDQCRWIKDGQSLQAA